MLSAASVLVCALSVLGRSERSMPPIRLLDVAPPETSVGTEAFVQRSTGTIYLITTSLAFRLASERRDCTQSIEMKKLASILAHEEWHVRHGPDEESAYHAQLITLMSLGVGPHTGLFRAVQISMLRVLEARRRNRPEIVVASGP